MATLARLRMAVLCLLVLLLSASNCKDPRVDGVTIDSGGIILAVGETRTLTAIVDAQFGASTAIEWLSSNPGVATVSSGGVVQGVAQGSTTIMARSVFDPSKRDEILATVVASSPQRSLTVGRAGSGTGTVTSTPAGIDCGTNCTASFDGGTTVTLTASAAAGSSFLGWAGACSGTSSTCSVGMTEARAVTAAFTLAGASTRTLLVTRLGSGAGSVVTNPAGVDCGSTCAADFAQGTSVTLTATAASGSVFSGWGGACSGASSTCTVSMSEARGVTATFVSQLHTLAVTRTGSGTGTVTSTPAGIDCGAACSAQFAQGTSVTLTASAAVSSRFSGWSGACTGSAATCTVSMTQARGVTATFDFVMTTFHTLSVTRAGQGSGMVTSSPAGIDCGSTCSAMFALGTSVTLTASPTFGQLFSGWSGACTGTATTCTVSMTQARSVTATFSQAVISIGPPNDDFANSSLLTGTGGSTTGRNRFATKEASEPPHAFTRDAWNEGGKSVWWYWTAPNTGGVVFDTIGSSFDTMLGVYTGSALNQLTSVGYNDDTAFGPPQSRVVVPVIGGVTYRIVVDGYQSLSGDVAEGDIILNWGYTFGPEGPPLNDNFAFGFVMRGSNGRTTGTNMLATKESGEPNHFTAVGASVWWRWTAPSTGSVTISTAGSTFDTVLAVYTGSAVNGLTLIASNDDSGGAQSRVTFTANAYTTYRIAVDGFKDSTGVVATGIISLNWGP